MGMAKIRTLSAGTNFLHAYGPNHEFRVVALAVNASEAQEWTITDRGSGRFTIHQSVNGTDRYLTAEVNGGTHVFAQPKIDDFDRQTWRNDQSASPNKISLGESGSFLQVDFDGLIIIEPDLDGPQGFDVELAKEQNLGQGSEWTPLVPS
jgi:hypothetical protein